MNGFHNGCSNMNGLKPNINDISQNKADDNSMMQIILKPTLNDNKNNSGHHYGSNTNISSPLNGLPGVRGRTRVSTGGLCRIYYLYVINLNLINIIKVMGNNNENRNSLPIGKPATTDTEEDETVDFLLKSAMTVPKGQPPKKRTKKYGDRKSCNQSTSNDRN
jgi:hypothetical protein